MILVRPLKVTTLVSALRMQSARDGANKNFVTDRPRSSRLREPVRVLNEELCLDLSRTMRLHQISMRVAQTNDLVTLLHEILDAATEITGVDMGNIQLLEGNALAARGLISAQALL